MTQKDKQLLLIDLCARLPYSVKCYPVITNGEPNTIGGYCEVLDDFYIREVGGWFPISMIKPFLRPMSNMTEEEKKEFCKIEGRLNFPCKHIKPTFSVDEFDWLNAHHFDYRGLIPKGLALEAKEGMYNKKEGNI